MRNIRLAVHSMSLTYSTAAVRELYLGFKSDRRPLDRRREYKRLGTVGMTGSRYPAPKTLTPGPRVAVLQQTDAPACTIVVTNRTAASHKAKARASMSAAHTISANTVIC